MARGRSDQVATTRHLLLTTAERLFAEEGISTVSNRHISEAAGQGNNFAVGYHFGGRLELVRAILDHHNALIEPLRHEMIQALGPDPALRDWIACLVQPQNDYLGALGTPTYFARFCAQVSTDPGYGPLLYEQATASEGLMAVLTGLYSSVPPLPGPILDNRDTMARNMIVLTIADFERAVATGEANCSWAEISDQLVDVLVALWLAPVTRETR